MRLLACAPQKTAGRRGAGMCAPFLEAVVGTVENEGQAKAAEKLLRLILAEFKVGSTNFSTCFECTVSALWVYCCPGRLHYRRHQVPLLGLEC